MNFKTSLFAAAVALSLSITPAVFAGSAVTASVAEPAAGDVSGTYTWSMGGGGGGNGGGGGATTTLVLKQDGAKLTGTISGRGGDTPIEDGSVDGSNIKFTVTREFGGNKIVTEYSGTVSGSDLKLKVTTTRDIDAKKSA